VGETPNDNTDPLPDDTIDQDDQVEQLTAPFENTNTRALPADTNNFFEMIHNPKAPDWYSTTYDLNADGVLMTLSQNTTLDFYANIHLNGFKTPSERFINFRYKNTDYIYTIEQDPAWVDDEYLICYPLNYKYETSLPVYFFVLGTHNLAMFNEALELASISADDYGTYTKFTKILNKVSGYKVFKTELFGTGINPIEREYILSGFSYGATKALWAYTTLRAGDDTAITKLVNFNPWIGRWATGFTNDPYQYLNSWHSDELNSLHSDYPSVDNKYDDVYTNIIRNDFASKHWNSVSDFDTNGDGNMDSLALSWGVNFVKNALEDNDISQPPTSVFESIAYSTYTGNDHTIVNWKTSNYQEYDTHNYITGTKIITSKKSFDFTYRDLFTDPHNDANFHFHWTSNDVNNLQIHNVQDNIDISTFYFDFDPQNLLGSHFIHSAYTTQPGVSQGIYLYWAGSDTYGHYYLIYNDDMEFANINPTEAEDPGYLREQNPSHLDIHWDIINEDNPTTEYYYWYIEDTSRLHTMRRLLTPSNWNPTLQITEQPQTIGFTDINSSGSLDTYPVHFYLYDIGGGVLKWGHINVGGIDNYKIAFTQTSGTEFNLLSNTYDANTAMYTPTYSIEYYDTNRYLIKNTDVINSGTYLKKPTYNTWQQLQNNTINNQLYDTTTHFMNIVWEQYDPLTESPDDFLFNIEPFTNIQIPALLGDSLTNNVDGVLTNTFLLYPQYLRSPNGNNILTMERNGNLIIWTPNGAPWHTNSYNHGNGLVIKSDGNLLFLVVEL
jgi:hypothetical protein